MLDEINKFCLGCGKPIPTGEPLMRCPILGVFWHRECYERSRAESSEA